MDTTALRTAASAFETHSEVLRSRAHLLARQRDAMRWRSPAAGRCRVALDGLSRQLLASGTAVLTIADDLSSCATRVAQVR
jgi:hypothetical protein